MNRKRTIEGILFEAIYHAVRRATGLSAQETAMYGQVREDLEKHGYEAAAELDREHERERESVEEAQEAQEGVSEPQKAGIALKVADGALLHLPGIVLKVEAGELARQLDDIWPVDEETGEDVPARDVVKAALVQKARCVLQQLLNGYVPTDVTVKLVDLYLAVRREYDDQVRLIETKAGISDDRRPSMRERFNEERLQSASETLAEAAPYEWGRTSLELS